MFLSVSEVSVSDTKTLKMTRPYGIVRSREKAALLGIVLVSFTPDISASGTTETSRVNRVKQTYVQDKRIFVIWVFFCSLGSLLLAFILCAFKPLREYAPYNTTGCPKKTENY